VYGTGTFFTGNVSVGDTITVGAESKVVGYVTSFTELTVNSSFAATQTAQTYSINANTYKIYANVGTFANCTTGDILRVGSESAQIVYWDSSYVLSLNKALTTSAQSESCYKVENVYPKFSKKFYVRNSKDQVFKCIANDSGIASTVEPKISIGGERPDKAFIETADGYRWKYLYSISYGEKQKFMNSNWMPVHTDNSVTGSAVNGRIDHVVITSGGDGYTFNGSSNSANATIITVTGDGEEANITARLVGGVITELNILDGGQSYTRAEITTTTEPSGNAASFDVVIAPYGGHGSNPAKELGCYTAMVSVNVEDQDIPTA
jgi:hypothetical protein